MAPVPGRFHDRAVVALSKRKSARPHRSIGPARFHDRAVVALSKRNYSAVTASHKFRIPRPRGRGLIEARSPSSHPTYQKRFHDRAVVALSKPDWFRGLVSAFISIPRPRGRGLIEAVSKVYFYRILYDSTTARSWPYRSIAMLGSSCRAPFDSTTARSWPYRSTMNGESAPHL